MKKISATEARNNFSEMLNQAVYGRESILIEKRGKPFALVTGLKKQEGSKEKRPLKNKLDEVESLSGGISLGKISKKLTPDKLNKIIDQRYEKLLS